MSRSNYRKIGDYIQEVKVRNTDLEAKELLGININKFFMPSVANVVGTDLSNYKVVQKGQFACNRMHVGRDYRIPISLSDKKVPFMVSPAYDVFEIIDTDVLIPEYLMMWFSRKEFDRNAWFYTDADVRGGLAWEAFCNIELPVPSITKQKEIVAEYNTIQNRIKLNEQLIKKLEETAQAIYREWFVEFEFPAENGRPYKSSGGKMVWCEELGKEIPKGWLYCKIQKLIDDKVIYKNQDGNHGELHPKSSDYLPSGVPFIMAKDIENGFVNTIACSFISNEQAKSLRIKPSKSGDVLLTHKATMGRVAIVPDGINNVVLTPQVTYYRPRDLSRINKEFIYCLFNSFEFNSQLIGDSEQSTRSFLSITNQRDIKVLLPSKVSMNLFKNKIEIILKHKFNLNKSNSILITLLEVLLLRISKSAI